MNRQRFLVVILTVVFLILPSEELCARTQYDPENAEILWTGEYAKTLVEELKKAEEEIFVLQYLVMGRGYVPRVRRILDVLKNKARRGVDVRIIADGSREGSYGNPINSMLNTTLDTGSARVTVLSPQQVMHSKVVIIDSSVSFIGSQNWTKSGLSENLELAALVKDRDFSRDLLDRLRTSLADRLDRTVLKRGEKSINDVTFQELKSLPIIGRHYAGEILDFRRKMGLIRDIDQLNELEGIGEKRMKVLRDYFGEEARETYKKTRNK
jgi:phosphatidylserine/phosphatidylglycerophosphate/cardiolipin synthase-like enzyme